MSKLHRGAEKVTKAQPTSTNRTDKKLQNEDYKPKPAPRNANNNRDVVQETALQFMKHVTNKNLSHKSVIPPISSESNAQDFEITDQEFLPLKLFDGKKQSLNELSEESMSYLWLRRIKEIFLRMADGKDDQNDDRFVEFDMDLARTDLMSTCDRYIENERSALSKQKKSNESVIEQKGNVTGVTNPSSNVGSLQDIQDCIKELNKLISTPSTENLSVLLNRCIKSLEAFDKNTQRIIEDMRRKRENSAEIDASTILQLMQSLQTSAGKKEMSELEIKQEWDMKKLYAEVFKMSYKRNPLRTDIEKEDLTPKKRGDDQPNFGNAIWWYSCDKANIYYQINSILRLENFELLMSYRYYLSDLCRMIEYMYNKRKDEYGDISQTFYRAGNIGQSQLKKMEKQQKGQLISLVGFISTTTDVKIAERYARKQHISKDNERVLFEIMIKPQEPCTAFAYIKDISFHPEEEEVLFSMGSTFTVDNISKPKDGENFYRVQLIASDIDKTLIDDIRTKIEKKSPSGRAVLLAQYLMELGEYRATRKYLNSLLAQADEEGILFNDPSLASIYSCLGMTYARQGLYGDAIKSFKQALNTQARLEYSNNNVLANIHNQIGLAYVGLGHVDEAEETFSEALRIQIRELNSNQQHLAAIYSNIGYVHYKKENVNEAQSAFDEAEKIYKKRSSKIAHDELEQSLIQAEYLTNYGRFLSVYKSSADAQEKYNEALKLYKNIVPENDPKLMETHINIMLAYAQKNKEKTEVTKWFEQSTVAKLIKKQETNMFELNSSVTQSNLAFLHEFMGACYAKQDAYDKAIDLWTCALVFKHKARLEELLLETNNSTFSALIVEQKSLIDEGYRLAYEYYNKPENKVIPSGDNTNKQLPTDFCLGFLHAQLCDRDQAITYLEKAIPVLTQLNSNMLHIAYLLSADILQQRRKYEEAIRNFDAALEKIKLWKEKDLVLEVEIELARSDCCLEVNSNDIISRLQKLGNSLNRNDADTKRISLQVIVYDALAQCCLKQKIYDLFDAIAEESMALKLRNFSQYHPSLAINLVLIAERLIQLSRYREALDYYEQALEVQSLNLTDKHPKIRKICYAMGDIYCKLDKLSNATEKYDVAENKGSESDDDFVFPVGQEKMNAKESMDIYMARIGMHQHLADYYLRKQNYKDCITKMYDILDLLESKLPSSAFGSSDETPLVPNNIDLTTLITNLKQLVTCYLNVDMSFYSEQDNQNNYVLARDICLMLYQYDRESMKKQLILVYQKLSEYYEHIGENEDALYYLQKTINLEEPTISTLYRLGYLNMNCEEFHDAVINYENLLTNESVKDRKELSQIIQEKLKKAKTKLKKTQRRSSTTSDSTDDNDPDNRSFNHSVMNRLSRNPTNLSATSHAENENENKIDTNVDNTDNVSDYRAIATAYLQLGDIDMCIKYHDKYIKKCSNDESSKNIFNEQLKMIEERSYCYEQDDTLALLPRLFHGLNEKFRKADNFENSEILQIADSFFQCGVLYQQKSSYLDSANAYISAFGLYMSISLTDTAELIGDINKLLNVFIDGNLDCDQIIEVCTRYLTTNITDLIHVKVGAMYRENEIYMVEDLDGDGDTSNESRNIALKWYKDLLSTTNDILVKRVCYYNILNLYKRYIYEDDNGKSIVESMMNLLSQFTGCDRRVLVKLASHFIAQYDNNTGSCDMKMNRQLQKMEKDCFSERLEIDEDNNIGKYLIDSDDREGAQEYWNLITEQIENSIPHWIFPLVRESSSTFDDILYIIKQPENDTMLLFNLLVNTYESSGDYYMLDAKNDPTTAASCFQQAEQMYKKAVHLLKRLKSDSGKIREIAEKQQEATSQITANIK